MAAPGRIVDGRYVVEAELGSGGMGVVLRVRHRFTGALHALKMLRPDFALDAEAQTRFLAEARAATAIGHHGIVSVLDAGKTPEGELYLVMELLQGQPLRNAMVRTGITAPELRRIGLELLDALGAAHARGFVHRAGEPVPHAQHDAHPAAAELGLDDIAAVDDPARRRHVSSA